MMVMEGIQEYIQSALADPAAGTLIFNSGTGVWSFVPAANYNGSTTFTFTYNDGYCDSAPGVITLNVLPELNQYGLQLIQ